MGIKIVERGNHPDHKTYEARCGRCHSLLTWQKVDAKRVVAETQRDPAFTQIDCPVCGNYVTGYE